LPLKSMARADGFRNVRVSLGRAEVAPAGASALREKAEQTNMIQRHVASCLFVLRRRVFEAAWLGLVSCGQACSGTDIAIIGGGGAAPAEHALSPAPSIEPPATPVSGTRAPEAPGTPNPEAANPGMLEPAAGGAPAANPPGLGASAPPAGSRVPVADEPSAPLAPASPPVAPAEPATVDCEPADGALPSLKLTSLVNGLVQPTFATAAPGDDRRLFVLERAGTIRVVRDGQLLAEPFLDLTAKVATSNEEGLVGLAFHPDYAENGRFFVQYSLLDATRASGDNRQVVSSEFTRSPSNPDRASAESERTLMLVEQPSDIHLGGMLAFGPDRMLYISRGDGGSTDAQDLESWLGKILRIDVDTLDGKRPYGIPAGNMVDTVSDTVSGTVLDAVSGTGVLPEIWSYGWRNPWRFGFDACTGDLYIGDVGESRFEEINFEPANSPGRNYGWSVVEGTGCFEAKSCDVAGFTSPVLVYEHDFGCAVTSGYVYRGHRIPALRGTYLYADYCFGNFGSLRVEGGQAVGARDITLDINPDDVSLITSFGADNAGELYVLSQLGGLYRIDPR
jgi:glucose/arabinose dehydrogenase